MRKLLWILEKIETLNLESLPSSYDAMALGYVTPVKDQGACGSCWLFAAAAELESRVLMTEGVEFEFSEQELGDCNIWSSIGGHDFCDGGHTRMVINYMTKYGAGDEACHPYVAMPQTCYDCSPRKNVNNWRMITGADGESQIETIKNAVLVYGAVSTHIHGNDTGFLHYKGGVYEYWGSEKVDHSLELIGWNDTLPHSHGTGAWLVKNSWGTDWGASGPYPGCAWVAYGAANIGEFTNAIASYKDPDDVIFYHDECGCLGYDYGGWGPTAYGAVRFTPSQDLTLTAIDFWTGYSNMEYEITIFDTFNDDSSGYSFTDPLGTTQVGTIDEVGYYSILLDTPVPLVSGDDFIVQVKFTAPGNDYPVPIDYYNSSKLPAWSEIATFSGESYCSETGTLSGSTIPYDIGIRARAEERSATPTITSFCPLPAVNDIEGATRTFNISIDQEVNITWLLNEVVVQKNMSVSSASYTNTSAGVGTWNVSAIGTNADWTDMRVWTWNVTEKPVPIAAFTYSPQNQVANQPITFNASNSTASAKAIASYDWNFWDGVTGTAKIVSHSYTSAGNYSVTLTVTDKADLTNSTSKTVTPNI